MPFLVAYDDHKYTQETPFRQLDEFVNDPPATFANFAQGLGTTGTPGQGNYGPFASNTAMQAHWNGDWIDASGRGGAFWPYLTAVDIHGMLTAALNASVSIARDQGKPHTTVWLPIHPAPDGTVDEAIQPLLFTVAVHEAEHGVQLVIVTPQPPRASS